MVVNYRVRSNIAPAKRILCNEHQAVEPLLDRAIALERRLEPHALAAGRYHRDSNLLKGKAQVQLIACIDSLIQNTCRYNAMM